MSDYCTKTRKALDRHQSAALFAANGHPVAHVQTDASGVPYAKKTVTGSKHFLRTPPGIAMDVCVLEQAKRLECRYVEIFDKEQRHTYRAVLESFDRYGFRFSRGFGHQVALPFAYWDEYGPGSYRLRVAQADTSPTVAQPGLFGGAA